MSEAADLLARLTSSGRAVKTLRATVSAYREDGTVNLAYGSTPLYGIPCLDSYTNRNLGDVVQVLDLGNSAWVVLGRIGGADLSYVGPEVQNNGFTLYDLDTLAVRSPAEDAEFEGVIGARAGGVTALLAWSYYNGTSNSLTAAAAAAGKTGMTLTVARSSALHGQREAVEIQLCPHNYDALPAATIVLDTAAFSPVTFRLEIGEVRNITLPADWWAALSSATPTIRGFALAPVTPEPWYAGYAIFTALSGGFRTF